MNCERVTATNSQIARNVAEGLLNKVSSQVRNYPFTYRLVGSASQNTIVKDSNGMYDLDYHILLKNVTDKESPSAIKQAFRIAFENVKNVGDKVEDSTTAITVKCKNGDDRYLFSIDFVIVTENLIIRRNERESYTWNILPSKNRDIYEKFDKLSELDKSSLIQKIIEKKCHAKRYGTGISSYEIFIQEVNNYTPKF